MFKVLRMDKNTGQCLVFDTSDNTLEYVDLLVVKTAQSKGYSVTMDLSYSDILNVLYSNTDLSYQSYVNSMQSLKDDKVLALADVVRLLGFNYYEYMSVRFTLYDDYLCLVFTSGCNFYCVALNMLTKIACLSVIKVFNSITDGEDKRIYSDEGLLWIRRKYYDNTNIATFKLDIEDGKFNIRRIE